MAIGRFDLFLSSSLMQCLALRTDRCELVVAVVDIGLGLRRMWKVEGQVGFSSLGDDVNKSLEEGKAAQGLADLAGVGV